jgi:hypothetical protein
MFGKKDKNEQKHERIEIDPLTLLIGEHAYNNLVFQTQGKADAILVVQAKLQENGNINDSTDEKRKILCEQWCSAKEANKVVRARQDEQERIQRNKPDMKYHILWNQRNGNPQALYDYVNTYNLSEQQAYLKELKARPQHYWSLFKDGKIIEASEFLEKQLERRLHGNTNDKRKQIAELRLELESQKADVKKIEEGIKEARQDASEINKKLETDDTKAKSYTV